MFALAPLYGSLEGFETAFTVLMFGAFGLALLLVLVWWAIFSMFLWQGANRLVRVPRIPRLAPAEGRSLPEWTDAIHLHAVAWLHMDKVAAGGPAVRQELQRVISGIVEREMATVASLSQRQAVTKVVVGRLLGELGDRGERNEPV